MASEQITITATDSDGTVLETLVLDVSTETDISLTAGSLPDSGVGQGGYGDAMWGV
ncbi:hypothetical protein [Halomarina oriensis]|uniref:Uncharacterized protein n=1 Tax=Halomarina oriensis TaxID=671145 RepID=A0A6B0GP35_9EURY|nr:hypothetical protein [Halomarina oriensis]MWG36564.1 hypothetical protein [Halomarina oriensis]